MATMPFGWRKVLAEEISKPYFVKMMKIIDRERENVNVYPPEDKVFRAFELVDYDQVEIVIVGQDPYPGLGQANGLCFAVSAGTPRPVSLRAIFKEVEANGFPVKEDENTLEGWARQGVFLLNTALTVREGDANSHSGYGWGYFTDFVIRKLDERDEPPVFILWGNRAKEKSALIHNAPILPGYHPAARGGQFYGCEHFKLANKLLIPKDKFINWSEVD